MINNIPIFLSADNKYAPFIATTIASICKNTKSFCNFYILDCGITDENKEKILSLKLQFGNFSIEFLDIDLERYFKELPETRYISKAMYSRFLIPFLKPDINKAIYSDVDVIILGDIAQMYNEDLEGFALGAVWEEFNEGSVNKERKKHLLLSNSHKYFCSGTLLLNGKQWRSDNILNKLLLIACNEKSLLSCPDQDILNKYFDNNYKVLPSRFNFLNQFCNYSPSDDILIRHFNGPIKPWHINPCIQTSLIPNKNDFWDYAKLTEFYHTLYSKVEDAKQQSELLRKLRLKSITGKKALNMFNW